MSSGGSKPSSKAAPAQPDAPMAPNGAEPEVSETQQTATIRIILADTQAIYRVVTKKIFALEDDIRVVAHAEKLGQFLAASAKFPADVLLFEAAISLNTREAVCEG